MIRSSQGTGSATVLGSTASSDVFAFISGQAGGSDNILNFYSADTIALLGYGTAADANVVASQKVCQWRGCN